MAAAATIFLAVAVVITVGYLAGRLARASQVPEIALLLVLGLALGPGNRVLADRGWGSTTLADALDPGMLDNVAPLVSAIALVTILFEAGLGLDLRQAGRSLGPASLIAFPVLLLTSAAIAAIGHWIFGMPSVVAIVLGVALSNVGQTVSNTLLRRLATDDATRAIGLVEMALYDILSVPILVALFLVAGGVEGTSPWQESVRSFAGTTSISLLVGATGGFGWLFALARLQGHPHSYMLTMAALLATYGITEQLDGAGAVSVLLFGLIVGNRASILRRGRQAPQEGEEIKVQAMHEEVSFLVRTVFFLFLGLSFALGLRDRWPVTSGLPGLDRLGNTVGLFAVGTALVLVTIPLVRALVVPLVAGRRHPERRALVPIFAHGLGTAVLATLPFVWRDFVPGTAFHALFAPWEPVFVNLAFLVILISVLGSSALVFLAERTRPEKADGKPTASAATSKGHKSAEPTTQAFSARARVRR